MRSFEYYTPTKVIFGKDTHLRIGEILKDYNCHKILIHYGGKSAVKSGLIDDIKKCLTDAGLKSLIRTKNMPLHPNPPHTVFPVMTISSEMQTK